MIHNNPCKAILATPAAGGVLHIFIGMPISLSLIFFQVIFFAPPPIVPEVRKPKKIGYAFSDQQILALIEDETNPQWQFAYQLLAVYGLRPEELRHLRIVEGVNGKELHSIYQKSMGGLRGDKTKPRKLQPLFVKDADRNPIDWKLKDRYEIGEDIPP